MGAEAQGSPSDARAFFLLVAKRKKPKKMRPPRCAAGFADSPALLGKPGGCGTRGFAPQTVLADYPRPHSVARRRPKGANTERNLMRTEHAVRSVFLLPFASSSSAGRNGKKGEDCLRTEGPSSAALPLRLSSAEHPAKAGRRCGRAFSLATFFLQEKRKYARASGAEHSRNPAVDRPTQHPVLSGFDCRHRARNPYVRPVMPDACVGGKKVAIERDFYLTSINRKYIVVARLSKQ